MGNIETQLSIKINVVPYENSEYLRLYKPCIRTSGGGTTESVFLVVLKNADGGWSKYFAALRLTDNTLSRKQKIEELIAFITDLYNVHFAKEIKQGYTVGEVILYQGTL